MKPEEITNKIRLFDKVHWFIYFVPTFYIFAAITGLCLGLDIPRLIFDRK